MKLAGAVTSVTYCVSSHLYVPHNVSHASLRMWFIMFVTFVTNPMKLAGFSDKCHMCHAVSHILSHASIVWHCCHTVQKSQTNAASLILHKRVTCVIYTSHFISCITSHFVFHIVTYT